MRGGAVTAGLRLGPRWEGVKGGRGPRDLSGASAWPCSGADCGDGVGGALAWTSVLL